MLNVATRALPVKLEVEVRALCSLVAPLGGVVAEQARAVLVWLEHYKFRLVDRPSEVRRADDLFPCKTLGVSRMLAGVCLARQQASEASRTRDTWRGQAPRYPHCQTCLCADGRRIRAKIGGAAGSKQRPQTRQAAAAGGWDSDLPPEQRAARDRLAARGLLGDVPTLDEPPEAVRSKDEDDEP